MLATAVATVAMAAVAVAMGLPNPAEASAASAVSTATGLPKLLDAAAVPGSSAVAAAAMAVVSGALGVKGLSLCIISHRVQEGGVSKAGPVPPPGVKGGPSTRGVLWSCWPDPPGLALAGVTTLTCIT